MIGNNTDEIINEVFHSPLHRYQIGLEESMKNSDFVFVHIDRLYYRCNKILLNRGGSYIGFPEWIKQKKATIYQKNK